jgi:hypothetical protein
MSSEFYHSGETLVDSGDAFSGKIEFEVKISSAGIEIRKKSFDAESHI